MRGDLATELVRALDLDLSSAGICLACLTYVAFPLDLGDERDAQWEARKLTPILWDEGLELTLGLALETAKRDGIRGAGEAIADVRRYGGRSRIVRAVVWRLAELMVEDLRRERVDRRSQSEPSGAIASTGCPVTSAISSK